MPKVFLTTTEMAEILGIGKTKAVEIMHMFESEGRVVKVGKSYRVRRSVLERWLYEQDGVMERL